LYCIWDVIYVLVYYIHYYYEKTMSPPLIIIANPTAANDITIRSCAVATMNIPQSVCSVLVGAICLLKKPLEYCVCGVCVCRVWSSFADEDKKIKTKKKNKNKKIKTVKTIENDDRSTVYHKHYVYYGVLSMRGVGEKHRHREYNKSCDT